MVGRYAAWGPHSGAHENRQRGLLSRAVDQRSPIFWSGYGHLGAHNALLKTEQEFNLVSFREVNRFNSGKKRLVFSYEFVTNFLYTV
jgi:hypothetical protein